MPTLPNTPAPQDPNTADIAHLAARLKAGDHTAWERLVNTFRARAVAYFITGSFDSHTAEDLVQESFAQAYGSIHTLSQPRKLIPWFYTIASRVAAGNFPSRTELAADSQFSEPLIDTTPHLDAKTRQHVINTLTQKERELLYLRYAIGLSPKEIAAMNDMTYASVATRLWKIRRKLTRLLRR